MENESIERIRGNMDLLDEGYPWDEHFSSQFDEDLDDLEKDLKDKEGLARALSIVSCENGDLLIYKKALEIIKEKDVDITSFRCSSSLENYNLKENGFIPLTQEEYDLLKEMLL